MDAIGEHVLARAHIQLAVERVAVELSASHGSFAALALNSRMMRPSRTGAPAFWLVPRPGYMTHVENQSLVKQFAPCGPLRRLLTDVPTPRIETVRQKLGRPHDHTSADIERTPAGHYLPSDPGFD